MYHINQKSNEENNEAVSFFNALNIYSYRLNWNKCAVI